MKRKELLDLRTKSVKDLLKLLYQKRSEASKKKMEVVSGKEKNLKSYRNIRSEIAKLLTVIKEKEIMEKLQDIEDKKGKEKQES